MAEVSGTPRPPCCLFFPPPRQAGLVDGFGRIHALLRLHSRRRRASFPADLHVVQTGFSFFLRSVRQTLTRKRTGVNSWLPASVQVRRLIKRLRNSFWTSGLTTVLGDRCDADLRCCKLIFQRLK